MKRDEQNGEGRNKAELNIKVKKAKQKWITKSKEEDVVGPGEGLDSEEINVVTKLSVPKVKYSS